MRTIVNHNAQAWADDYLALSGRCMVHASEIETSGTAHPLHWHIHGQLQSIGRLAFDIQACILRANQPTDKEPEMKDITFTPLTTNGLGEVCDKLSDLMLAAEERLEDDPNNALLQQAKRGLVTAINAIEAADMAIAEWHQAIEDRRAVDAIRRAINVTFSSERNVGPANGMLQDVAAFGPGILAAIRDAGYTITPPPPF